MKRIYLQLTLLITLSLSCSKSKDLPATNVEFRTSDILLQNIYDEAAKKAKWNIEDFGKYKVLVEGGGYNNVWLETQPMGGYMYAKRNLAIARNNQLIFIDHQREDGRLPGMITKNNGQLEPKYGWFQGLCFPMPAFELYYWLEKDKSFLTRLYQSLKNFDHYLWQTRDSDNDGCLETWCIWDTGEDGCIRFNQFPNSWPFDHPPAKDQILRMSKNELRLHCNEDEFNQSVELTVPIESMDIMSYSYSCRDVLSLISKELNNGKELYWREKANMVRRTIKEYLWIPEKNACYDRDKNNIFMDILLHNNLRCMYYGAFDQDMADEFIKFHLLNPEEFWTSVPLPSIAVNDPKFRNIPGNNWSGQPQGLTFQRSIRALENYGHYAEVTLIGEKLLQVVGDSLKFTQQFYPFAGKINSTSDGYGPTILATLEFVSRLYGIHMTMDIVYWSNITRSAMKYYKQEWGNYIFEMQEQNGWITCYINDKDMISFTKGARIVTDLQGNLIEIVGIDYKAVQIEVNYDKKRYSLLVEPNTVYKFNDTGDLTRWKTVAFDYSEE